ncbi:MAG: hypothetical protein L0271_00355 [Gemmatimonadetes bacterium]|nr:hypothetical protein [Gemmatimonadota bacterium]
MARILLVEDEAGLAYGLRNNLEMEGHHVDVVDNGPAGLELALQGNHDLIILDTEFSGPGSSMEHFSGSPSSPSIPGELERRSGTEGSTSTHGIV